MSTRQQFNHLATVMHIHLLWHQLPLLLQRSGFRKKRFFKKPNSLGFLFYWVVGFIGFPILLSEWAVGKLDWFSLSAKLLFRFSRTSDYRYLKICKFVTLLVVRRYKHKETFNYYWHDKVKLNYVWGRFLLGVYPQPCGFFGYDPGVCTLAAMTSCVTTDSSTYSITCCRSIVIMSSGAPPVPRIAIHHCCVAMPV